MEILDAISSHINWNAVQWIIFFIVVYYLMKKIMRNRKFMKIGMTTKNLLLFANLKNYVNGMEQTQRKIYENMLHEILMSDDLEGEIVAIENAADELHTLMVKKDAEEQHAYEFLEIIRI
jgi:hypothetical protein